MKMGLVCIRGLQEYQISQVHLKSLYARSSNSGIWDEFLLADRGFNYSSKCPKYVKNSLGDPTNLSDNQIHIHEGL